MSKPDSDNLEHNYEFDGIDDVRHETIFPTIFYFLYF